MKTRRGRDCDAPSGPVYPSRQAAHASALVRLCVAREQFWRAETRQADARGTPAESHTLLRVSEAAAEVAMREQWLHWIDHGTSLRPEADGAWGRPMENQQARSQRLVEGPPATGAARRRPAGARGPHRPGLWSAT